MLDECSECTSIAPRGQEAQQTTEHMNRGTESTSIAPRGQEAQQTTEHMNRGTESHPSVARQLEETQGECFAHALKRPEGSSPFVVLKTGSVFQKEVIYHLKLRLQALFHLTSL